MKKLKVGPWSTFSDNFITIWLWQYFRGAKNINYLSELCVTGCIRQTTMPYWWFCLFFNVYYLIPQGLQALNYQSCFYSACLSFDLLPFTRRGVAAQWSPICQLHSVTLLSAMVWKLNMHVHVHESRWSQSSLKENIGVLEVLLPDPLDKITAWWAE